MELDAKSKQSLEETKEYCVKSGLDPEVVKLINIQSKIINTILIKVQDSTRKEFEDMKKDIDPFESIIGESDKNNLKLPSQEEIDDVLDYNIPLDDPTEGVAAPNSIVTQLMVDAQNDIVTMCYALVGLGIKIGRGIEFQRLKDAIQQAQKK